jgi:hypothetical protein
VRRRSFCAARKKAEFFDIHYPIALQNNLPASSSRVNRNQNRSAPAFVIGRFSLFRTSKIRLTLPEICDSLLSDRADFITAASESQQSQRLFENLYVG